jgi:hypothetical protein
MKVVGKSLTLIGTEGSCPPLPYIEVSDSEGKALIGLGYATKYVAADAPEAEPPAPAKAAKGKKAAKDAAPPPPTPEPEKVDADAVNERMATIVEALDLVEGEPTVEAVADITGLADVTAEEIDAAKAAKEAAE